jgi:hypothetical protein
VRQDVLQPRRRGPRPLGRAPREVLRHLPRARQRERRRQPLLSAVSIGGRGFPCTRRRARLATCLAASGERPTMMAISSKDTSNRSCRTNASRSDGASLSGTTKSARPTESARSASCSASVALSLLATGSVSCALKESSRREVRERNMSRRTRATTVVSHPARLSMPLLSGRLSRSPASRRSHCFEGSRLFAFVKSLLRRDRPQVHGVDYKRTWERLVPFPGSARISGSQRQILAGSTRARVRLGCRRRHETIARIAMARVTMTCHMASRRCDHSRRCP